MEFSPDQLGAIGLIFAGLRGVEAIIRHFTNGKGSRSEALLEEIRDVLAFRGSDGALKVYGDARVAEALVRIENRQSDLVSRLDEMSQSFQMHVKWEETHKYNELIAAIHGHRGLPKKGE